jgi:hypothetical protein
VDGNPEGLREPAPHSWVATDWRDGSPPEAGEVAFAEWTENETLSTSKGVRH